MNRSSTNWLQRLPRERHRCVTAVDTHTGGELTRVILAGGPELPELPAAQLREHFAREHDDLRRWLTSEPRGHKDLEMAWLAPPADERADASVVFMDARRYPLACGTATVGAVVAGLDTGLLSPNANREVVLDTPSGLVSCKVEVGENGAALVSLRMVPACLTLCDETVTFEGRSYRADLGFVGGFLALVEASQLSQPLADIAPHTLIELGEGLTAAGNAQWDVRHPFTKEPATVDGVVFYDAAHHDQRRGWGMVIYGAQHLDRSPCGTGTTVKMAKLHQQGLLKVGEEFLNHGPLDTSFLGRLDGTTRVGEHPGIQVTITASAHMTAFHEFFTRPGDPLAEGFRLGWD